MSRLLLLAACSLLGVSVAVAQPPTKPKPPADPPKVKPLPDLDDATITAYQKAGGKYGAFKKTSFFALEFLEGKNKCEPGMMVGFYFSALPKAELADAKGPFALRLGGINDGEVKRVKGLTNLAWLDLAFNRVGDAGLKELATFDLKSLAYLNLSSTDTSPKCLKSVGELKSLAVLNLGNMKLADADLADLKPLAGLTALQLFDTPATAEALKVLKDLPKLTAIHLDTRMIDDKAVKTARELNALHKLPICTAGPWGVFVGSDADVRAVYIRGTKATSASIAEFKGLKTLERVYAEGAEQGDALLKALADNGLLLAYEGFGDKAMKPVKKPEEVLYAALARDKFTPASLKLIEGFKNLEQLHVNYSQIGDESVPAIKKFAKLNFFVGSNSKLTDAGVKELKAAFPKATVLK